MGPLEQTARQCLWSSSVKGLPPQLPSLCAPGIFPPVAGFASPWACLFHSASWTRILFCCFRELHVPLPFLLS